MLSPRLRDHIEKGYTRAVKGKVSFFAEGRWYICCQRPLYYRRPLYSLNFQNPSTVGTSDLRESLVIIGLRGPIFYDPHPSLACDGDHPTKLCLIPIMDRPSVS